MHGVKALRTSSILSFLGCYQVLETACTETHEEEEEEEEEEVEEGLSGRSPLAQLWQVYLKKFFLKLVGNLGVWCRERNLGALLTNHKYISHIMYIIPADRQTVGYQYK